MSYVQKVIQPGESMLYMARVHWIVYLPGLLIGAAAFALVAWAVAMPADWRIAVYIGAGVLGYMALHRLLMAAVEKITTELAVTDRRVIAKVGFIQRRTWEINNSKVEGVEVNQSILGRVFGYGTVMVKGTGGGFTPVHNIDDPLTFRNHVTAR